MNILITRGAAAFALAACASAFELHPMSHTIGTLSKIFVTGQQLDNKYIKNIRKLLQMPSISDHPHTMDVILPEGDHRWITNEELYCRIYENANPNAADPVIFWIHGGGFTIGSIYNDDAIVTTLQTLTNKTIISLSYGLAPENKYPQGLNDVTDAIESIIDSYKNPPEIILAGESAGAHLCLGVYYILKSKRKYIKKLALVYPPIRPTLKGIHAEGNHATLNGLLTATSLNQLYNNYVPKGLPISTLRPLFPGNYHHSIFKNTSILLLSAKYDILHDEIVGFANSLQKNKVNVTLKEYNDIHGFFGRFGHGNDAVEDFASWLAS